MKITHYKGKHVLSKGDTHLVLSDAELVELEPMVGVYVDTLDDDAFNSLQAAIDRYELEHIEIEGRMN